MQRVCTHQLPGHDERVIDLELLSVRNKFRGAGVGKYLLSLAQNKAIVGSYDAVVTCADSDAVAFYEKHSFSVDAILNSRYADIGDIWTNTTKMCYVPPYEATTSSTTTSSSSFIEELTHMERDYSRWQKMMFGAYQSQAKLFLKLKNEIFALKASLCAKESVIDELKVRNDMLERENRLLRVQVRTFETLETMQETVSSDQELANLIDDLERCQP